MLTGALGIRILLLVGDAVPLPAPPDVTAALRKAEVTCDADGGDGFQLTFALARDAVVDYSIVLRGALSPFKRVTVALLMGALPEVLIDGVITHQQLTPGEEPGSATLTVTGKDVSVMLDLEEKSEEFPNQPDFLIAGRTLAPYARYGMVPQVTPTADIPLMIQRIPRQHETDLALLKRLADRNGFVFYVEPVTLGVTRAYFGPENRLGIPQSALTLDMGAASNVRGMHFSHDGMAAVQAEAKIIEPITKAQIPIPAVPALKLPPLAPIPSLARRKAITRETANAGPAQAILSVLSAATRAPDPVTAEGEMDTTRYGHVLRARRLVGVRGAGFTYNGLYYVRRVTHSIDVQASSYTQRFSLSREGTGSLLPVLVP
ncbi:MAG TPA: hypothetical protein VFJ16_27500 [Longimicrobium sp.]|nr:hypothetical protein [Longimicrobium sp.]